MALSSAQPRSRSARRGGPPAALALRPFEVLARLSLLLGTLGGFATGIVLLLPVAFRLPIDLPWLALAQVHGQLQTLGFAALFIFAVGTVIFPRFLGVLDWDSRRAMAGGFLLAAGVTLRAISQPLDASPVRFAALVASGLLSLAGPSLYAFSLLAGTRRSVQPLSAWHLTVGLGFASLELSLLLNLVATLRLGMEELLLVPLALDEAIVLLQVRGFIVCVGLSVGLRVFSQFLFLRPARQSLIAWIAPLYGVGLLLSVVGWLLQELAPAQRALSVSSRAVGDLLAFAALIGYVIAIRLFEPAARASGRPHVTNPARTWIRLAFLWLLGSILLMLLLSGREAWNGTAPAFTAWSAARHALTMGFMMVLLFGMSARILPGYSGWALQHPRFVATVVYLLLSGAALRVSSELLGGYSGIFGPLTGLGGVLGTAGFLLFAASLWPALDHLPVATRVDETPA